MTTITLTKEMAQALMHSYGTNEILDDENAVKEVIAENSNLYYAYVAIKLIAENGK